MLTIVQCNVQIGTSYRIIELAATRYVSGGIAIIAVCEFPDGLQEKMPVSVNVPEQSGLLNLHEFFLKDWSDKAHVAKALMDSGILVSRGKVARSGYVSVPVVAFNPQMVHQEILQTAWSAH